MSFSHCTSPFRVSFCVFFSRNVSKGAGCLTNCCTKKQVCITDHCLFCTLLTSSSVVDYYVILVHSTDDRQAEVLDTNNWTFAWCSIRACYESQEQMMSLDCELTQWCQMLQRACAVFCQRRTRTRMNLRTVWRRTSTQTHGQATATQENYALTTHW